VEEEEGEIYQNLTAYTVSMVTLACLSHVLNLKYCVYYQGKREKELVGTGVGAPQT